MQGSGAVERSGPAFGAPTPAGCGAKKRARSGRVSLATNDSDAGASPLPVALPREPAERRPPTRRGAGVLGHRGRPLDRGGCSPTGSRAGRSTTCTPCAPQRGEACQRSPAGSTMSLRSGAELSCSRPSTSHRTTVTTLWTRCGSTRASGPMPTSTISLSSASRATWASSSTASSITPGAPFQRPDWFSGRTWEGHDDLPALDHENPEVLAWATHVARHWLDRGGDGWRFDVAYAIPRPFLRELTTRVRAVHSDAFLFGEMIHGDYAGIVHDTGLDGVTQCVVADEGDRHKGLGEVAVAVEGPCQFPNVGVVEGRPDCLRLPPFASRRSCRPS